MRNYWQTRVKKLALAYKTGWEYLPGSSEAGSVLTDIFLEMTEENRMRCRRVWEKQELEFLQAVPEDKEEPRRLKSALSVRASGGNDGGIVEQGTRVCAVFEHGMLVRFRTVSALCLTAAKLQYAIYRRGLCAWLSYDRGTAGEDSSIKLFQPVGQEIAHPVLRWYFRGLWDGRRDFSFLVRFREKTVPSSALPGRWAVTDGQSICRLEWQQSEDHISLSGECPEFADNFENSMYEISLEISAEELSQEWMDILWGGFSLGEAACSMEPELCLTDEGGCGADRVLPFGSMMYEASCCYFACDRAAAAWDGEITLQFKEGFEVEEKTPEVLPKELAKLYKKYPWLQQSETVHEWKAERTVWEYFNGKLWCVLPGSEDWAIGCAQKEDLDGGTRALRWRRPHDMQPCAVEGEEHFYIRLRLCDVSNAYAACYRKYVPVLEKVRFSVEERWISPKKQELPDRCETEEQCMYLGFDHKVDSGNRWYDGEQSLSFTSEQILGEESLWGRRAFWIGLKNGEARELSCLAPNYVEILQELRDREELQEEEIQGKELWRESERGGDGVPCLPAGTAFSVETGKLGVLDAVSVSDAHYGAVGTPLQEARRAAEQYFAHFRRLVTPMDMELLLQERYPFLNVADCILQENGILKVELAVSSRFCEEAGARLPEIREWLEAAVSKSGVVWLQGCSVSCNLKLIEEQSGKERRKC